MAAAVAAKLVTKEIGFSVMGTALTNIHIVPAVPDNVTTPVANTSVMGGS